MAGKISNPITLTKLTAEGLALQFVERESEIAALVDAAELESTCKAWDDFNSERFHIEQDDSGV
jgi:hypothetical protein